MKRVVLVTVFALATSAGVFAQSGRRIARPSPAPTPAVKAEIEPGYSESKPRVRRANPVAPPTQASVPSTSVPTTADDDEAGAPLRVETNLITIPVSVFDRYGLYIPGIRQTEFKIFEDGIEQEIAYFATTDKPFTVVLVIDVSPSTAYRIEEIRRAARAFVDQLKPQDSVAVIDFDHNVRVTTKPTQNRQKIYEAIEKAEFGEGTSLYNAVDEALRKQLGRIAGRKAILLFTDGVDTTSRKNSYASTLNYAEESDALIFPIYYNTYLENRRRIPPPFPNIFGVPGIATAIGTSAEDYRVGREYLDELADSTGGRVFRPESTPGGLTRAFEGIAEELRRQYNVGYVPKDTGTPGQRKEIKIRVERPGLLIRSRDSYIVGSTVSAAEPPKIQK